MKALTASLDLVGNPRLSRGLRCASIHPSRLLSDGSGKQSRRKDGLRNHIFLFPADSRIECFAPSIILSSVAYARRMEFPLSRIHTHAPAPTVMANDIIETLERSNHHEMQLINGQSVPTPPEAVGLPNYCIAGRGKARFANYDEVMLFMKKFG